MSYHPFFLSYARVDRDPILDRFYAELNKEVRFRSGDANPGFMDGWTIKVGESWEPALFDGLQSSAVLVPVYTATYFRRPVCGREWEVFRLRQHEYTVLFNQPAPPAILPLLWGALEDLPDPLPEVAAEIQHGHNEFGELYAQEGLRTLMSRTTHRKRYLDFLDAFAARIIELSRQYRLPRARLEKDAAGRERIDTVEDAFRRGGGPERGDRIGPRYVKFVYVAATQQEIAAMRKQHEAYSSKTALEWHPYHPPEKDEVVMLAQEVTFSRKFIYQEIPFDVRRNASLLKALEEAEQNGNLIVLIVDPWTLRLQGYFGSMQDCDAHANLQYAVAVPWNLADPETLAARDVLEATLANAFQHSSRKDPNYFLNPVGSADELKRRLAESLEFMSRARQAGQGPGSGEGGPSLPLVSST
ncbi:MAG TPA: FxsC protein [Longimicrobiaceae bacterium]|nr:FxsC protein [Longimicrobiaceae bacterium]